MDGAGSQIIELRIYALVIMTSYLLHFAITNQLANLRRPGVLCRFIFSVFNYFCITF